jgi:hypothetical protein
MARCSWGEGGDLSTDPPDWPGDVFSCTNTPIVPLSPPSFQSKLKVNISFL